MSAVRDQAPLGGFEQRLLTALRAHVGERPVAAELSQALRPVPPTASRRRRVASLSFPGAAGLVALVTGGLTLLPAATPPLAEAFPILDGPTSTLPARLVRALRAQWRAGTGPDFDLARAHAFRTAAGTGYVVIDRRSRWICILIPGFSAAGATGRCERVTLARLGQPSLTVRIRAEDHRQEIVALLPRGAAVSATVAGRRLRVGPNHGVLAVVSAGAVTVTTTVANGRGSRVTYTR